LKPYERQEDEPQPCHVRSGANAPTLTVPLIEEHIA
jgi:hypothetical protein